MGRVEMVGRGGINRAFGRDRQSPTRHRALPTLLLTASHLLATRDLMDVLATRYPMDNCALAKLEESITKLESELEDTNKGPEADIKPQFVSQPITGHLRGIQLTCAHHRTKS